MNSNPRKVITGPDTRFDYCNVWEGRTFAGVSPKYSVCLLIPKGDTITVTKIKAAIQEAYREGIAKLRGASSNTPTLNELHLPLLDGDKARPDDPVFRDMFYLNAASREAPGIVDENRHRITDRSQIYSGIYGRASVTFYAYNVDGHRGIAAGLNNLQKLRDGMRLGGDTAESDFAPENDDDDVCPF